jgi:hypothetical protein
MEFKIVKNGKGSALQITLPLTDGEMSKSGKSMVVASTKGIVDSGLKVNGKALRVGVNAFY